MQLMNLDFAWFQQCGKDEEFRCAIGGCAYGVVVEITALLGFGCSPTGNGFRVLTAACALELMLYVVMVLIKYPHICPDAKQLYSDLEKNCHVMEYMYLERVLLGVSVGIFGITNFCRISREATGDDACSAQDDDDLDSAIGMYNVPTLQSSTARTLITSPCRHTIPPIEDIH